MITYLIKSGLCLALLLAFYHLILEREKMHQFNRFYLLGSVLFSFLTPLYTIYIEAVPPTSEILTPMIIDNNITMEIVPLETEEINYTQYLLTVYAIIALILLVRFTKNLTTIFLKIKQHQKIKKEKATLVLVDDTISPHTFWNYIFINKEEYYSDKIETELYTHELTHALQKHTLDILLIEFLQIIFWINPTFIFLKKAIKLNHEFLADNEVIITHKNTTEYQYLLLNRAAWNNEYYLASNLNYLLTKKRLLMMTKQSSRTKILLKKLAVITLLIGFIMLFAEKVEAYENNNELLDSEITQGELPKEQITTNSSLEDIKNKLNNANSLKMSFTEKRDTFNVDLPNGEQLKVWEDKITDYNKLNKKYEGVRNQKPHYIKSSEERQKQLNDLFSKLGSLYFNLSKTDKTKVKRPVPPHSPYVRLKKEGDVYYKLKNELTKEDKKLLPPPPASNKTNYTSVKSDSIPKLKRIVNGKKGTFTYTTKEGTTITKKINELTGEEKKMLPPPIRLKEKPLSIKLFEELKNAKNFAIWIDGKSVNNNVLNNYKNTDFYNYNGSFVHKNARSKRFPQEYQYQLNTKEYIQKIKKQLPPPPSKNKKNVNSEKKLGWIVGNKAHEINIPNKSNEKLNVFDIISHDKILNNYTIKRYFLNNKEVPEQHLKKIDYLNLETTRMKKISDEEINIYITTKN
ncbi:hypothetical protein CSC81_09890 [Tenacibaculum discolor]|uniref:M56 family metallopeptidase n=1 Tax=Tenacibaculum discolor TaxID=361581 RepID=A0A2G1BTK7_9FLAO|nr:M56 family metallopeptidase [Tenacibaculum discolor]MDP2541610.1 M56 family metallopeptidase [Tenacibaculum discolor]PHN97380.1 hypothetical protein CSC81_09890 [Tenacibaculum discolor]